MIHPLILIPLATAIASPGAAQSTFDPSQIDRAAASSAPVVSYDPGTHERVTYKVSRQTGGFIDGVNSESHKTWHANVHVDRSMTGKDEDGNRWTYDPKAKLFKNLATGRTCAGSGLSHVCAQ
jgi:hypothetical protein